MIARLFSTSSSSPLKIIGLRGLTDASVPTPAARPYSAGRRPRTTTDLASNAAPTNTTTPRSSPRSTAIATSSSCHRGWFSIDAKGREEDATTTATTTTTTTGEAKSFLLSLGYSDQVSDGVIDALVRGGISHASLLGMAKGLAGRYEVGEDGGLVALAASVRSELEVRSGGGKVRVWCLPSTGWSRASDDDDDDAADNDHDEGEGGGRPPPLLPTVRSMDRAFLVEAVEGTTLADVARFGTSDDNSGVLGEYLECACSGIMACSTCHVVIHPDWYDASSADAAQSSSSSSYPVDVGSNTGGDGDVVVRGVRPRGGRKIGPPSDAEQDMIDLAYEPQYTSRLGCQIVLTSDLDGLVILLPGGSNNLMDHIPFE